jgi:hypothetical protein
MKIPEKRMSETQAKKSLRSANSKRQYSIGTVPKFGICSGKIMDLFAEFIEQNMTIPPNGGRGCRISKEHIELCFGKFYQGMREFMDGEKNE